MEWHASCAPDATISCRSVPNAAGQLIRGLERWLWTGPVGHLVGGVLDFLGALWRYLISRARERMRARPFSSGR